MTAGPAGVVATNGRSRTAALDEFFALYRRLNPVNATFIGWHEQDGEYPDWSPPGIEDARHRMAAARRDLLQAFGPALGTLGNANTPTDWPLVDATLADAFLEIQDAELASDHFPRGNPSLAIGEATFGLIALMTRPFAPAADRFHAAASRLRGLSGFLDGARASVAQTSIPIAWRDRALREVEGALVLLSRGVEQWIQRSGAPADAVALVREYVPVAERGIRAFADWLAGAARTIATPTGCGEAMFELLWRRGHWYRPRSIEQTRTELRERLPELQAQLAMRARAVHPEGWKGVQEELALRHPTADEYYDAFDRTWRACHSHAAAHDLVTWPEYPIRYQPIPEFTRGAAPYLYYLYYRAPAPYDQLQPVDYVVPPIEGLADDARARHLRAWNDSVIKLNHVVHHGAIGHHVQNWYAYRAPSRVGQLAAVDCASRIGMFGGGTMAEGWACYATDLMDEVGFLTPFESCAEAHTRVRMLARAIADVELHTGRMSLDATVRFYEAEVGMAPDAARSEAVKNSMFPGTASMYWIGTQGIHDLRAAYQRCQGRAFSLRQFHDRLLAMGSIPVPIAAELLLRQPAGTTGGQP